MRGYYRRRGWSAWHIAALPRAEKFPALHELTGEQPSPQRLPPQQTPEQIDRVFDQWAAATAARKDIE